MDPSLSDLHLFSLILRWGFPLLFIVLLTHHFILNYFHERGEQMAAMAKLVKRPKSRGGRGEKTKKVNKPAACVAIGQKPAQGKSDSRLGAGGKLAPMQSDDAPA